MDDAYKWDALEDIIPANDRLNPGRLQTHIGALDVLSVPQRYTSFILFYGNE